MSDCKDAEIQARHLIRQFQRKVRAEGLPVECNAFRDPVLLRGRITQITEYRIKVRLEGSTVVSVPLRLLTVCSSAFSPSNNA